MDRSAPEGPTMEGGDAMLNPNDAATPDRRAGRTARGWGGGSVAQPPVDPQTVRAFGLVMGLPEFQRR